MLINRIQLLSDLCELLCHNFPCYSLSHKSHQSCTQWTSSISSFCSTFHQQLYYLFILYCRDENSRFSQKADMSVTSITDIN